MTTYCIKRSRRHITQSGGYLISGLSPAHATCSSPYHYSRSPNSFLTRILATHFSSSAHNIIQTTEPTPPKTDLQSAQEKYREHRKSLPNLNQRAGLMSLDESWNQIKNAPGSALVPQPSPHSVRLNIITEEEKQEQLALIDELTDYIRAYRHPTTDSPDPSDPNALQPTQIPNLTIIHSDYFFSRPETTIFYNQFIRNHAVHRAAEQGLGVQQLMTRKGVKADEGTYIALIEVCGAALNPTPSRKQELIDQVFQFYEQSLMINRKPTLGLFNSMIVACRRLHNSTAALRAFDLLKQQSHLRPNNHTYTSLLTLYRDPSMTLERIRDIWFELRTLSSDDKPDLFAYNVVIRAAAQFSETEWALQLYNDMQQHGLYPNAHTYVALMFACAKRPDFYIKCFEFFEQAISQSFVPDNSMMNTLLTACCKNADLNNALTVFHQMETYQVRRDTVSYNLLLQTIANTQAQPLYKLTKTNVQLTQKERMEMCERLLIQMEANDVPIDDITLFNALRVWTVALRLRTAEEVRQRLIRRYVEKDRLKQKQKIAMSSLDSSTTALSTTVNDGRGEYDVRLWECMLTAFIRAKKLKDVMNVLSQMRQYHLHPSALYYDRILYLCALWSAEMEGEQIIEEMKQHGFTPSNKEIARLFDRVQYQQYLRDKQAIAKEGAIRTLPEEEKQAIRDRAWLGQKIRIKTKNDSDESAQNTRPKWIQSKREKKSREHEYLRQRRVGKALLDESMSGSTAAKLASQRQFSTFPSSSAANSGDELQSSTRHRHLSIELMNEERKRIEEVLDKKKRDKTVDKQHLTPEDMMLSAMR